MNWKCLTLGALAVLMAIGGQAAAQGDPRISALVPILAPQPGNKACYSRAYDTAHMKAHPQQRITAMKFLLAVQAYDPKPADATKPEDLYYYTFSMSVARRGARVLFWSAGCHQPLINRQAICDKT